MYRPDVLDKPRQMAEELVRRYGQLAVFQAAIRAHGKAECGRFNRDLFWADVAQAAREILNSSRVLTRSRRVELIPPEAVAEAAAQDGYARRVGARIDRHSRRPDGPSHGHSHGHSHSGSPTRSSSHSGSPTRSSSHSGGASKHSFTAHPLVARVPQPVRIVGRSDFYPAWGE